MAREAVRPEFPRPGLHAVALAEGDVILPIITFDDLYTVIGRINGRPKPLAL